MKAVLALAILALTACSSAEPESAANRFERTEREIGERENALRGQVDNEVAQTERRLEAEASAALNSLNAAAAEEAPAAAGPSNKLR